MSIKKRLKKCENGVKECGVGKEQRLGHVILIETDESHPPGHERIGERLRIYYDRAMGFGKLPEGEYKTIKGGDPFEFI